MEYPWPYHRKLMGIPMDIRRNTMDFSWSIPWRFHGISEYGHAFVISTTDNPWVFHVFPMVNTWDLLWGFEYGHGKDIGIP